MLVLGCRVEVGVLVPKIVVVLISMLDATLPGQARATVK